MIIYGNYGNTEINNTTISGRYGIYPQNACNMKLKNTDITTSGWAIQAYYGGTSLDIEDSTITVTGNDRIIYADSGLAKLNITNSTLSNTSSYSNFEGIHMCGGTINISGDTTITSGGAAIYSNKSSNTTINIESGTVESTVYQAIEMAQATGTITIGTKDGDINQTPVLKSSLTARTINAPSMYLNFYDGKLVGPQDVVIGATVNELEDEYQLISTIATYPDGNNYEEITLGKTSGVAYVVELDATYNTLEAAVDACKENKYTVQLLTNIHQATQIKISEKQNITIDLNGHKLNAMADNTFYNKGTLKIIDSENESEYTYNFISRGGTSIIYNDVAEVEEETEDGETVKTITSNVTIGEGVKIYYDASNYKKAICNRANLTINKATIQTTGNYSYAICNTDAGMVKITEGNITTSGDYGYGIYNESTGTVEIAGGNITTSGDYGHGIYNESTGTVEIAGGNIITSGYYGYGIYNESTGTVEIAGGNITTRGYHGYGVHNESTGIVEIAGGNITTSGNFADAVCNNSAGTVEMTGGTITCSASGITNYKGIVNITDGIITANDHGIYVANGATVNIKGGTITCTKMPGIAISNGTVNIEGGTITSKNHEGINVANGTVNIKGGTITSENQYGINIANGTLTLGKKMTDQEIENGDSPNATEPSITGKTYGVYNTATFNFYDGAITGANGQSIYGAITDKEKGYEVATTPNKNEDGSEDGTETSILQKVYITEIIDTDEETILGKYPTIAELQEGIEKLEIVEGTYTIKVIYDFSISSLDSSITIPEGIIAKFDLNGHVITSSNNSTIINNGILAILDSSEEQTGNLISSISGTNDSYNSAICNQGKGILTIQSGTVSTKGNYTNVIYNASTGKVEITGGSIEASGSYGYGAYNANTGKVEITGGSIETSGQHGNGVYSDSAGTVKITKGNITTSGSYGYGIYNTGTGTVEITRGNITTTSSSGYGVYNTSTGTVKITEGNIRTSSSSGYGVYNTGAGTVEITRGSITTSGSYGYGVCNTGAGTVEMTGVSITTSGSYGYGVYNYSTGKLGIAEVSITTGDSSGHGVYNSGAGKVEITSGTIETNGHGVYNSGAGTVEITSGTIETKGSSSYGVYNYGTLILGTNDEVIDNSKVTITSEKNYGLVSVGDSTCKYYEGTIQGAIDKSIYGVITEMPEKTDISLEKGDVEIATIGSKEIAQIGGDKYDSLQDAIDACVSEEDESTTITILKDFSMGGESYNISDTQNIIIDLNGHRINQYTKFINEGKLEITDNTEEKSGIIDVSQRMIDNTGYFKLSNITVNSNMWKEEISWSNTYLGSRYIIYNYGDGSVELEDEYIENTVNGTGSSYVIYSESAKDITFKNGTIKTVSHYYNWYYSISYILYVDNSTETLSNIKLNGVKFIQSGSGSEYGIYAKNADIVLNEVDFSGDRGSYGTSTTTTCIYSNSSSNNITINSGHIDSYEYAIYGAGNNLIINGGSTINESSSFSNTISTDFSNTTINDGTISRITFGGNATINGGTINTATLNRSSSSVTMNEGSIYNTSENSVEISSGTFTQLGGTIESTSGYGVYISSSTGTFTMGNNQDAVTTKSPVVTGSTYGVYNSGGTFNFYDGTITGATKAIYGSVTEVPELYKVVYSENDTIATLDLDAEIEGIVSVDGRYFSSIEAAINNAMQVSEALVLSKDIELEKAITIPENADITINLNAHSIRYAGEDSLIVNNGILTIIDEIEESTEEVVEARIENTNGVAITNKNTLTIGINDGEVDTVTPNIVGTPDAIVNNGTLNLYDGLLNGTPVTVGTTIAQIPQTSVYQLASADTMKASSVLKTIEAQLTDTVAITPEISVDKELPEWTNQYVTVTIESKNRIVLDVVNAEKNTYLIKLNKVDGNGNRLDGVTFETQSVDEQGNEIELPEATITSTVTTTTKKEPIKIVSSQITQDTVNIVDRFKITETDTKDGYYKLLNPIIVTIEKDPNTENGCYEISSFAINGNTDSDGDGVITFEADVDGSDTKVQITATITGNTIIVTAENNNKSITQKEVQKIWKIPEEKVDNYRATLTLYKMVDNVKTVVTDKDGNEITQVIRGNGIVVFDNLEKYENKVLVTYLVMETKVEKLIGTNEETGEEVWEDVTDTFRATYKQTIQ